MHHTQIIRTRRYIKNMRLRVIVLLGGCCHDCGSTVQLELAHVRHTDINGRSRGSFYRARDAMKNPGAYTLLCRPCHRKFDDSFDPKSMEAVI